jgi:hypothetical protein
MAMRKLGKPRWQNFFDRVSQALLGKQAEIEVASLALGDQIAAEWVPLLGIRYDANDDVIVLALDGFDHIVRKPREVWVDLAAPSIASLEIIDDAGTRQIIQLRDPLLLPASSAANGPRGRGTPGGTR